MNVTDVYDGDEESANIFGSTNNGYFLFGAFAMVAAYLTICSEALNSLEIFTLGTSYHLMLQRMYREIMMVGFASFIFTILDQTDVKLSTTFYQAFGFADICCFVMASFFCVQGIFIMVGSVGQAQIWNVAANISSEELNLNVEEAKNSIWWKARYIPFCKPRDQVEFRMLRSIFTSAYGISTGLGDLDFGMFLRTTHEANILSIIEISAQKWCVVLCLTLVAAIEVEVWKRHCPENCEDRSGEIWIFTAGGALNALLCVVLFYWGRSSELKLIETCGVSDIEDYTVFLLAEDHANEALASAAVRNDYVRQTIAEIMAEQKNLRLQVEYTKANKRKISGRRLRQSVLKAVSKLRQAGLQSRLKARIASESYQMSRDSSSTSINGEEDEVKSEVKEGSDDPFSKRKLLLSEPLPPIQIDTSVGSYDEHPSEVASNTRVSAVTRTFSRVSAIEEKSDDEESRSSSEEDQPGAVHDVPSGRNGKIADNNSNREISMKSTRSNNRSPKSKAVLSPKFATGDGNIISFPNALEQFTALAKPRRPVMRQQSSGESWRRSLTRFVQGEVTKSKKPETNTSSRLRHRLKRNVQKQNFRAVFWFRWPELLYALADFVITCNSLYLAWWSTHVISVVLETSHRQDKTIKLIVIALLPALVGFPFLAMAIRSVSVLKAITLLNLDIVGSVMEQSAANAAASEEFKNKYLKSCRDENENDPRKGMVAICNRFSSDGICLSRREFSDMLLSCGMLYGPDKIKFIFSCIDINGGATIDMGEFESYLFASEKNQAEKLRQELYTKMNTRHLGKLGKRGVARKIIEKLSPHTKGGVVMHRLSSFDDKLKW
eukprot:CAMPEP_0185038098 /NCGR_PEP_ID=MMETSP1103-20130426/33326_1 /TAXON_ID=36769 /ORGANISM="Paraphysomonas bandaiensis, Strain Caron Lab Isolate" /LENGTH=833 /DNA_ID=CAMNT_0027576371 /DNA_START=93 /DNA_END=2591 /DNA_ORIENTATION=+